MLSKQLEAIGYLKTHAIGIERKLSRQTELLVITKRVAARLSCISN
tara:strand:+ start:543 stop:680 length:138 start_codon:yes stop_codon:yes gene_type:complete